MLTNSVHPQHSLHMQFAFPIVLEVYFCINLGYNLFFVYLLFIHSLEIHLSALGVLFDLSRLFTLPKTPVLCPKLSVLAGPSTV